VLHALHTNTLPFINDGEPVHVVEISTGLSLGVIVVTLAVTVLASLLSPRGKARAAMANARRFSAEYLNLESSAEREERERIYARMVAAEQALAGIDPRYASMVRDPEQLQAQLGQAHQRHAAEQGTQGPTARG